MVKVKSIIVILFLTTFFITFLLLALSSIGYSIKYVHELSIAAILQLYLFFLIFGNLLSTKP